MFKLIDKTKYAIDVWSRKQWERIKTVAFLTLMGAFLYGYFTGLFIT